MTNKLKEYFPLLREREELLAEIKGSRELYAMYEEWSRAQREEFLDFCTGVRGMKILYDSFFKEVMNPEYAPERLESFLCAVLKRKVKILRVLPNDSTRISDEGSLLITDIVVGHEDGALANVEIQKIGYGFPGERSACYSADMLLRQYRRVRSRQGDDFSYRDIKNVYLIVIYENSPKEFKDFPEVYHHHARQVFDSGLQINLLQEFVMIPLDIFHAQMHNKPIETPLEAWLTFLGEDKPEKVIELIAAYPKFKEMYATLYEMCRNTERVMRMFSEELRILDRNTVKYMIEEQQKEIDSYKEQLQQKDEELDRKETELYAAQERLAQLEAELAAARSKASK
ncbi:MAG: PD-(D/E)XK nuclease family transposase [Roseburia sp.]|nr:PD-(D/E)XK nuclease family transposase [Roseburia sp.]